MLCYIYMYVCILTIYDLDMKKLHTKEINTFAGLLLWCVLYKYIHVHVTGSTKLL